MGEFDIKLSRIRSIINSEDVLEDQIRNVQNDVDHIKGNLRFKIAGSNNIRRRLQRIVNELNDESRDMRMLQKALNNTADLYETAEKRICEAVKDGKISFDENIGQYFNNIGDSLNAVFLTPIVGPAAGLIDFITEGELKIKDFGILGDKGDEYADKINDKLFKDKRHELENKGYYKDGEWHDVNTDDEKESQKFDDSQLNKVAQIAGVEIKAEASLFSGGASIQDEYGSLSGSYDVLKAEAYINAYAGIYSVGPDGEKHFAPGIGGEIGASATAFTASGTAMLGDEMLGAYINGEVNVGHVGATAGGDIGFLGADGSFNPQANIHAEVEAIAAEATAAVGVNLLGTDVSGHVGVNVGVGAHADIGLHDGVLSFDVGASLGVGVSVDLEIDFGGTAELVWDAVSDVGSNAWEAIEGLFSW